MKITKQQLRKIIREEKARDIPIYLYSDEELLREGLFDFLGKMWGKLKGTMQKGLDKAVSSVKGAYQDALKDIDKSKLDPKKPDTFKDLALKMGSIDNKGLSSIIEALDEAAEVESWADLSDADQERSMGLWSAVGTLQVMVKTWDEYVTEVSLDVAEGNPETPAEAAEWIDSMLGEVIEVWEWLQKNVKADHVEKSAKSIGDSAKSVRNYLGAIAKVIKADAEEQQNEWIDLKYRVAGIIQEVVEEEEINPYGTDNYSYFDEDEMQDLVGHT